MRLVAVACLLFLAGVAVWGGPQAGPAAPTAGAPDNQEAGLAAVGGARQEALDGLGRAAAAPDLRPYVVEAALANGLDPAAWPAGAPLAADAAGLPEAGPSAAILGQLRELGAAARLAAAQPDGAGVRQEVAQRVVAAYDGAQFGDPALWNDDIHAMLVLRAAGHVPAQAWAAGLAGAQTGDGGWPWQRGGAPETDITGMALEALAATAAPATDPRHTLEALADVEAARRFVDSARAPDGLFALVPGGAGNCDSTVWAARTYLLLGDTEGALEAAAALALLRADGGFAYLPGGPANLLCTAEAATLLGMLVQAGLLPA